MALLVDYPMTETVAVTDTSSNTIDAVFTGINWFILLLPVVLIITGIVCLVKKKTTAVAILLAIAIPLPIFLFVIAAIVNSIVLS